MRNIDINKLFDDCIFIYIPIDIVKNNNNKSSKCIHIYMITTRHHTTQKLYIKHKYKSVNLQIFLDNI